jgi:hypothetical protein
MIEAAEILAEDLPFVRIDFYEVGNVPKFGEMTFYRGPELMVSTHWNGTSSLESSGRKEPMPPPRDVNSDFALCQVPDRWPGLEFALGLPLSTAACSHGRLKRAGRMWLEKSIT